MTVTSPRKRRAVSIRVAATLGAVLLALGSPAGAIAVPSTVTPTPTPDPGATIFTLSPVGNGVVEAGDPLTVSVSMQNTTALPTEQVQVTLELGRTALRDRAALTRWLDGSTTGVATAPVGAATLDGVQPGEDQATRGIMVPADDPALQGLAPGVYPLKAWFPTAAGTTVSTSAMIVPDDDAIGVGVVVPITAGPLTEALLSADRLSELTAPGGALTDQLDAVEGTLAVLAVDPAIPAAIRVLGSSAPASATTWLDRLLNLGNPRFALQFGDADPAVQIEAGLARPVAPSSLTAFMAAADFIADPDATPAPTPSATAVPGEPVYPDLADLLDIGGGREGVFWPAPGQTGPEVVDALGALGGDDAPSLTLVPSASTAGGSAGGTVPAHGRTAEADLLVYDTDVSRELSAASRLDDTAQRGAPLTAATAYLAFAAEDRPGSTVLVGFDRDIERSRVGLRTAVLSAFEAPGATPATLAGLVASPATEVTLTDAESDPVRVGAASALFADETTLARFATILDEPRLLTGPERAEVLQLLSVAWLPIPVQAADAVASHRAATTATLGSVHLLPTNTINLFGSGAGLRFTVRNDLPYPVNLVLYASPDDLRLDVQRATDVVATAASNTRVEVPVQARLGNGEVTLALQLRSRASVAIGPPETVQVNVRAEWETFGLVALGVIVGGLVVLGVIRTVRRMRARSGASTEGGSAPDDSPPGEHAGDDGDGADGEDRR
jgi:hypothetical protein